MAKKAPQQVQRVSIRTSEVVMHRVVGNDVVEQSIDQRGLLAIRFKDGSKWFDVFYDEEVHKLEIRSSTGRIVLHMSATNLVYVDTVKI